MKHVRHYISTEKKIADGPSRGALFDDRQLRTKRDDVYYLYKFIRLKTCLVRYAIVKAILRELVAIGAAICPQYGAKFLWDSFL